VRKRWPADEEILAAVVELADDGFCKRRDLVPLFRGVGERSLRKSISRAARRGLVLERRAPDGRCYLAVTGEGWELLRSLESPPVQPPS